MHVLLKPVARFKPLIQIVFGLIGLSIAYGILHDLITANVCVEYFTVYHPHLINSNSPEVMALLWGAIPTWWVGAIGGAILGLAATSGSNPCLPVKVVLKKSAISLVYVFAAAVATLGICLILGKPLSAIPFNIEGNQEFQARVIAVAAAHMVSYLGSTIAVIALTARFLKIRRAPGSD